MQKDLLQNIIIDFYSVWVIDDFFYRNVYLMTSFHRWQDFHKMSMKELSINFMILLVKEFKAYVIWLDTSVYMSKTTCFVVLQYHHLQTADLILHLKMLEIICIKHHLSISFENQIRLIKKSRLEGSRVETTTTK